MSKHDICDIGGKIHDIISKDDGRYTIKNNVFGNIDWSKCTKDTLIGVIGNLIDSLIERDKQIYEYENSKLESSDIPDKVITSEFYRRLSKYIITGKDSKHDSNVALVLNKPVNTLTPEEIDNVKANITNVTSKHFETSPRDIIDTKAMAVEQQGIMRDMLNLMKTMVSLQQQELTAIMSDKTIQVTTTSISN